MDILNKIMSWEFMDESAGQWFVWLGVMIAFLWAWNGILDFMK